MDFDGDLDFDDIDDFVWGLIAADVYEDLYGVPPVINGDVDGDGDLDFDDIAGFVALLEYNRHRTLVQHEFARPNIASARCHRHYQGATGSADAI
jgi:hypothetical protein